MEHKAKYDAQRVFRVLGNTYQLTDQQARAIDKASLTEPELVVAGAGSGKTELMAARVIWLIANEFARPDQILGLTFTRKAAASLSKRVNKAIAKLQQSDICPPGLTEDFTPPTIGTYNSYANSLFRENALQLGFESDAIQLTESQQYQLAREIVVKHGAEVDPSIGDLEVTLDTIVEGVLKLAQSMQDNQSSAAAVSEHLDQVETYLASLEGNRGNNYEDINKAFANFGKTRTYARLAERLQEEKKLRNLVDYADQVALAERAARTFTVVAEQQQEAFKFVLLDEYQDTSYLQTRLLSALFAQTPVFAVGDPNQAIYGWRGASASNLHEFHREFKSSKTESFDLTISMRNPKSVLEVANHLVSSLGEAASYLTPEQRSRLAKIELKKLRTLDTAGEGTVSVAIHQNVEDEAQQVAAWFKAKLDAASKGEESEETYALLLRRRRNLQAFVDALQDLGLPTEVIGVSGLLTQPEIIDLVAALRSMHYPNAGSSLIRLLTGPRFRVGPKDIAALFRFARREARIIDDGGSEYDDETVGVEDNLSLIDAIDEITYGHPSHRHKISTTGLARMQEAAKLLAEMRRLVGLPLADLLRAVAQELLLDIELMAKPNLKNPLANLNSFYAVAANFANGNTNPSLGEFLTWLEFAAKKDERFDVPAGKPAAGVIQILTVHASKGLEWDHVAVADMAGHGFPATSREGRAWLSTAQLPYELRGDKSSLPVFDWATFETQKAARDGIKVFEDHLKERQAAEERRLIYVATTRPKQNLLLSGSWSTHRGNPVEVSTYILETLEMPNTPARDIQRNVVVVPEFNPSQQIDKKGITEQWPQDPLGPTHGPRVRAAQSFVLDLEKSQKPFKALDSALSKEIRVLMDESEVRLERLGLVEMPVRIPASRFKDFVKDTAKMAEAYLRPTPAEPFHATMSGTLFHAWVEQSYSAAGGFADEIDSDTDWEGELAESSPLDIEALKATFEKSRFYGQTPKSIEQEIQVTIDQTTFICKIDAIFATDSGVEIVDWKTGKAPVTPEEIDDRSLQLALYRMAYARHSGLPEEQIEVCLYYVTDDKEIKPQRVKSLAEIEELWRGVLAQAKPAAVD